MQITEISPALADAADVLSDQLRAHLQRLAIILVPHADALERRFTSRLARLGFEPRVRTAMVALTAGAAARILARNSAAARFIEQVEYHGRRLAKLNQPPTAILEALGQYDRLLEPLLTNIASSEAANLQWVREQLHFCVVLTLNNAYYQVREAETQAFYELFRVELESRTLEELLSRFLHVLVRVSGAVAGAICLVSADNKPWVHCSTLPESAKRTLGSVPSKKLAKARHFKPDQAGAELLLEPDWENLFRSCWSVPLSGSGRLAGVMQFGFTKHYEWLPREQELLLAAAERCLMAAERAQLMENLAAREEQIRRLAEHMLHVEEMERRRISRELHDEAGQSLLCMRLQMEMLEHALPPERTEWLSPLREARDLAEHTILEMRRLIAALSPAVLEQLGLGAAIRQLVNRFRRLHPIQVKVQLHKLVRLPQGTEIIIYRLVQECFNNIAKHSQAKTVNLSVNSADGVVRLNVEDNGVGFDIEAAFARRDSFGLSGMRERVALLGGDFRVESFTRGEKSGRSGTRIAITLPFSNEDRKPVGALAAGERPVT